MKKTFTEERKLNRKNYVKRETTLINLELWLGSPKWCYHYLLRLQHTSWCSLRAMRDKYV